MHRPSRPGLLLAASLIAGIALFPACSGDRAETTAEASTTGTEAQPDGPEKRKETPVPVEVVTLQRGEIRSVLRATTNLEAENEVEVFSQAARLVRELRVEEGDAVRKGDLLVRLQDDEQTSALAKARSQHDKAAREYERQKRLFENDLISEEIYNNATYELEQLKIAVEDAERELGYTLVRAPISGTITQRLVQVGDNVTVGQHLFDIIDFDSIVARIYVPEKELPRLQVGQTAAVTTQGAGAGPFQGRVSRISPVVDPGTGTVKVTVAFAGGQGLRPGMYVNVNLTTATHGDALLVPKRALVYDQDQVFVYRLGEERRVERLLLEPILEDKEFVEPLDGVAAGDQVVVAGQAGLKDRSLVRLPGDPEPEEDDEDKDEEEDAEQVARQGDE